MRRRARRRAGPRAGPGAARDAAAHPAPGRDAGRRRRPRRADAGAARPRRRAPRAVAAAAVAVALAALAAAALLRARRRRDRTCSPPSHGAPALVALDAGDARARAATALPVGRRAHRPPAWARAGSRRPTTGRCCASTASGVVTQTVRGRATGRSASSPRRATCGWRRRATARWCASTRRPAASCSGSRSAPARSSSPRADGVVWVADGARADGQPNRCAHRRRCSGRRRCAGTRGGLALGFGVGVGERCRASGGSPGWIRAAAGCARRSRSAREPGPIVAGAGGVWVANTLDSTVSLIDPDARVPCCSRSQVRGTATAIAALGRPRVGGRGRHAGAHPARARRVRAGHPPLPSPATALTADGGRCSRRCGRTSASHRGGTLRVRTWRRSTDPDTHSAAAAPRRCATRATTRLLGISVPPGRDRLAGPESRARRPAAAGRRADVHVPPATRACATGPAAACGPRTSAAASSSPPAATRTMAGLPARRCPAAATAPRGAATSAPPSRTDEEAGTVTLHLAHPDPELLWALALSYFAPSPTADGPVPGTGPYRVARLVPQPGRRPAAQPVLPRARACRAAGRLPGPHPLGARRRDHTLGRRRARGARRLHRRRYPRAASSSDLRSAPRRQLHIEPVAGDEYAWLNTRARPFDDVRVRRALAYAVDRGELARGWARLAAAVPDRAGLDPRSRPVLPLHAPPERGRGLARAGPRQGPRADRRLRHARACAITYTRSRACTGGEPARRRYMASLLRRLGYGTLRASRRTASTR